MKTITRQFSIYEFSELPEEVQTKIVSEWREEDYFPWEEDNAETLKQFCEIFPVSVTDYEYGHRSYINADYSIADDVEDFTGVRLLKYIVNNYWSHLYKPKYLKCINKKTVYSKCQYDSTCVLTGYFLDQDILQPIYDFLKHPTDNINLQSLLNTCLQAWIEGCRKDYDYWLSEKSIIDDGPHLKSKSF